MLSWWHTKQETAQTKNNILEYAESAASFPIYNLSSTFLQNASAFVLS